MHRVNLGTLLRTCDAVGACLAVPRLPWVPEALARGNTLRRPACVHWTGRDVCQWLAEQRSAGSRIAGIELAEEAVRLADLPAARQRTIAVRISCIHRMYSSRCGRRAASGSNPCSAHQAR